MCGLGWGHEAGVVGDRAYTALGALLRALWIVPTAGAATPPRFTDDFQVSGTIDCSEFNPAWTFEDDFSDFFHLDV